MTPLNFPIIRLLIGLIIGILLGHYCLKLRADSMYFLCASLILFIILYRLSYNQRKKRIWFGVAAILLSANIGLFSYHINDHRSYDHHYLNSSIPNDSNESSLIILKITERLKSSSFNHKYIAKLISIDHNNTFGNVLIYIKKDSLDSYLRIDDVMAVSATLEDLSRPLNPFQFNYSAYLEQQNIYKQITTDYNSVCILKSQKTSIAGYASVIREKINFKLKEARFDGNELAVINALLLGQRQGIDKELYTSYAKAGVVHILAVSGLHVGLILLILNHVLKPLIFIKHGRLLKALTILIFLWCFAIIASLSPSVTRAVTMFSLLTIAMHLKRPTNSYNTLAISALLLLLIDPQNLFKVGFQMSYLAVLSILFFQPLLFQLWRPKLKVVTYVWGIFTVTISAQIGVLPISLYYFHQFPGLFFIANLIIIPFLGFILGFGILTIIMSLFNILPVWIMNSYKSLIIALNSFVEFISEQSAFLIRDISFDLVEVIVLYLFIISLGIFMRTYTYSRFKRLLLSIILIQCVLLFLKFKHNNRCFVIFHKSRETVIAIHSNASLYAFMDHDSLEFELPKCISDYKVGNHIKEITVDALNSIFVYREQNILVVDSLNTYNLKNIEPEYVLLRNSPRINLNRLIDSIHPQQIIADGSNYKTYIQRWKNTCLKRKLPFHYTGEKGAFILK